MAVAQRPSLTDQSLTTFTDVCRMLLPKWSPPLDFREASFLEKPLASKLAQDVVTVELCQVRHTARAGVSSGGARQRQAAVAEQQQ